MRLFQRAAHVLALVRQGHGAEAVRAARRRLHSRLLSYGLRRDLTVPFAAPPAKMELTVRPLAPQDDLSFLDIDPGLPSDVTVARLDQRRLVAAQLPTCWVAVGSDGKIVYMQWLIGPKDNHRIRAQWGSLFPRLGPDEALLEGAYTVESARGQGVMAHAMARIAEAAAHMGTRWVITFVADHNVASLKGCKKAGFSPYVERRQSWLLFRRNVVFEPLPEGTPYAFELEAQR